MATKRGNVLSQSWRSKSAVFRMYHPLSLNGYSKIINAVKRQRNLGLFLIVILMCRSTWREETKIYVLHSFKSYKSRFNNHFQYFIQKKNLFPYRCHLQIDTKKRSHNLRFTKFRVLPIWKSGINHHFLYFITIFFSLKRYILANIIIVLLFPIAAICRSENRGHWEKKDNGALIWLLNLFLFLYNNFFYINHEISEY